SVYGKNRPFLQQNQRSIRVNGRNTPRRGGVCIALMIVTMAIRSGGTVVGAWCCGAQLRFASAVANLPHPVSRLSPAAGRVLPALTICPAGRRGGPMPRRSAPWATPWTTCHERPGQNRAGDG